LDIPRKCQQANRTAATFVQLIKFNRRKGMKLFKRFLMGLGTVLLLALSLQLVAPKAVHAVVSTLVTVANTSSNPVPVAQAKANYINLAYDVNSQGYNELLADGTSTPFSIPAGEKLVITDVSWEVACLPGVNCNRSAGDVTVISFGGTPATPGGFYTAQATYANYYSGVLAGASDHFQSGYVTSVLPAPAVLLVGDFFGETVLSTNIRGYLVPASAPSE
jgi:hypothetical protein